MCGAFTDSQRARRCWLAQSFANAFDSLLIGEGRVCRQIADLGAREIRGASLVGGPRPRDRGAARDIHRPHLAAARGHTAQLRERVVAAARAQMLARTAALHAP